MSTKQRKQLIQQAIREAADQKIQSRRPKKKRANRRKRNKAVVTIRDNGTSTTLLRQVPYISGCGLDYIKALMNPWSGVKACVPGLLPNFNQLATAYARGRMICGTSIGFVAINPRSMCFNDIPGVVNTTAGYAPGFIDLNTPMPGVDLTTSNATYANASVGSGADGLAYRVVGCGLRIRYVGKELDRGGQILAFHDPTHNSVQTRTYGQIDSEVQARRFTVKQRWTNVLYVPKLESEYAMSDTPIGAGQIPGTITSATNSWYMIAIVQPAFAGAPYEWEAFCSMEYQGKNVRNQEPTHSDPAVLGAAVSAAMTVPPHEEASEVAHASVLSRVGNLLLTGLSHVESLNESAQAVHAGIKGLEAGWHMLTDPQKMQNSVLGSVASNFQLLT